ncbi:MAG: hypothetical protein MRY77_10120 [Rhodobacteraceae bacterium]|nr:hypothetical protein [Paracoccaceae bacterium]
MDFTTFDSATAAETGADCHIKHPVTGLPLYDNPGKECEDNGKPCIVMVQGVEAPSVRAAMRDLQKARAQAADSAAGDNQDGPAKGDEDLSIDELHDRMVEGLHFRIVGFKNIHKGERAATKRDAKWFLNLNRLNPQADGDSFVEQIADFSRKRGSYLGNVSGG